MPRNQDTQFQSVNRVVTHRRQGQRKTRASSRVVSGQPWADFQIRIVNVIVSTRLNQPIDIERVAASVKGTEYEPEVFPGLIHRRQDPKATVIMFSTGKMTSIGTKSEQEGKVAIDNTISELRSFFLAEPSHGEVTTENLLAVGRFPGTIDLPKVAKTIEAVTYEPSTFPAAIYKAKIHASISIYHTGKLTYTGARSEAEARRGLSNLFQKLEREGCLIHMGE